MKNKGQSKFVNLWPRNPTQTMLRRAIKTPDGVMSSEFSKKQDEFGRQSKMPNKYQKGIEND
jgi:hypothetical protein